MIRDWIKKLLDFLFPKTEKVVEVKPVPAPLPTKPKKEKIKKCEVVQKVMFTREQATKRRDELRGNRLDGYLRIYSCQFCGMWHLTHKKTD